MSKPKQKQKARRMLVQALYSWDVGGTDLVNIEAEFHSDNDMNKVDVTLFHNILYGVPKNLAEIDGTYEPFLDRENKQLDPVSRAVLRLSSYEMLYTIDVPYKVVINEGVNLAKTYGTDILLATLNKDVSPAFVLAVIGVESHGVVDAASSADAVGLMQLIPETAKRFNVEDRTDPKQNIAGGVAYLDWLINEFNRDPVLALAGYNAGENAVKLHNGVPPFAQTRGYIPKVVAAWKVAKALCKTPPKYATDGCVFDFKPEVTQ